MTTPRRIVLTRTRERCESWRARLAAAGIETLVLPLIRHETLPAPADFDPGRWDWLLFTSPQAAVAFAESPLAARLANSGARCGALGDGTRAEMERLGIADDLGVSVRDGVELAAAFAERVAAPARVLLPGAEKRMREPLDILTAAGFTARDLPLYRTNPTPPDELPDDPFAPGDLVFFASPSTVRAFRAKWPDAAPDCAAIGETTAVACREAGLLPAVAARPDLESLCRAVGIRLDGPHPNPENTSCS